MDAHLQQMRELIRAEPELLTGIGRGIERECLRVNSDGMLAQTPHPTALGSALTHSSITTDYSEALLEFITPVSRDIEETLSRLEDVHNYVYDHIGDELLWSSSMPCIVAGDAGIPVALYGSSNTGRMKTVYRYGLGHRYGRLMQAIAGLHYNFSMPDAYWERAYAEERSSESGGNSSASLQDYITGRYLGLIRNFHRWSWLLIYLFGASPAVCASFMRGRKEHPLEPFDAEGNTLHLPHATSLRMGGLGYNSDAQASLGVCYNSLHNYLTTLSAAILTTHPEYTAYNGKQDGEYQQLNDGLLQIENEFYSTIRPKRPAAKGETALTALHQRGIEYIEVRCIDISPFDPLGVSAEQLRFLDSFLVHCLLAPSGPCNDAEQARMDANLEAVVNRGREPGLLLQRENDAVTLEQWASELLDAVGESAGLLNEVHGTDTYSGALDAQRLKVKDSSLTPSARVLSAMRESDSPFFSFALRQSKEWAEWFRERDLGEDVQRELTEESRNSLERQKGIEAADALSFEDYINAYYEQYQALQTEP